jgi:hypothetical protein
MGAPQPLLPSACLLFWGSAEPLGAWSTAFPRQRSAWGRGGAAGSAGQRGRKLDGAASLRPPFTKLPPSRAPTLAPTPATSPCSLPPPPAPRCALQPASSSHHPFLLLCHPPAPPHSPALIHPPHPPPPGLLVFADWYHLESVRRLRFFDDNTRSWWEAATGGANVPALNDLLVPFGAAFGEGEPHTRLACSALWVLATCGVWFWLPACEPGGGS